jgi:hypothetical protein
MNLNQYICNMRALIVSGIANSNRFIVYSNPDPPSFVVGCNVRSISFNFSFDPDNRIHHVYHMTPPWIYRINNRQIADDIWLVRYFSSKINVWVFLR